MIILDTDHISPLQYRDSSRTFQLLARLEALTPDEISTTVISIEEQMRGWLRLIRRYVDVHKQVHYYSRLAGLIDFFSNWNVLPFDELAADEFDRLKKSRVRIGTMDLKIASIALANNATLLSTNLRDFHKVPGLLAEDWLKAR